MLTSRYAGIFLEWQLLTFLPGQHILLMFNSLTAHSHWLLFWTLWKWLLAYLLTEILDTIFAYNAGFPLSTCNCLCTPNTCSTPMVEYNFRVLFFLYSAILFQWMGNKWSLSKLHLCLQLKLIWMCGFIINKNSKITISSDCDTLNTTVMFYLPLSPKL